MEEPWIERVIREAQAEGKFDDISGTGEPIGDLDRTYEASWWARRWIDRERQRDAAIELSDDIERQLPIILSGTVEDRTRAGLESLNARIRQHNEANPQSPHLPLLDVEALLAERRRRYRD